jgi:hypothetical protein
MMPRRVVWALVAQVLVVASAHAQAVDSVRTPAPVAPAVAPPARNAVVDAFDRIARDTYLRRHAFSLDHFLEFEPGGFVVRLGPIGNDAAYSRWGIGRGRALLRVNGIVYNDPQDDSAPLVHTPTSGLGTLSTSRDTGAPWIEGVLDLEEAAPPSGRPNTFVELSKGTNKVRQRRVRFSSEAQKVGVDMAYDEVLDDGYMFDSTGEVPYVTDYGSARSKQSTIALRGNPDASTRFGFGIRNFTSTTQGDLTSGTSEGRKSGYVTWLDASVADTKLGLFARGYNSTVPDSSAKNGTVGAMASWSNDASASTGLALRAGVERTDAVQDVGAIANDRVARASAGADATRRVGDRGSLGASVSVAGDKETPFAWGASVGARRGLSRSTVGVSLARSFRLPNFGERYLPAHTNGANTLAGSADVDPETAWEVGGDWSLAWASTQNRVRAAWIRADQTIAFRPRAVGSETWRVASNASDASAMLFLEERMAGDWRAASLRISADAAVLYTSGDRADAFATVPEFQVNASLMFGRDFFEESSALFVGATFLSAGERHDYSGTQLPAFNVLNLMLEGRLLDARLYVQYLNVLDESYTTQGDYLMTPQTFAYGIEWTLFN